MDIPYEKLSKDALHGLIREYILREGTDYGHREWTLSEKIQQVEKQIINKSVIISYDPETESFDMKKVL